MGASSASTTGSARSRRCTWSRKPAVPGLARRLLHVLEDKARQLGYAVARLDTGPRQGNAQGLYESEGYAAIEDFNGNPVAVFWGEKPLTE